LRFIKLISRTIYNQTTTITPNAANYVPKRSEAPAQAAGVTTTPPDTPMINSAETSLTLAGIRFIDIENTHANQYQPEAISDKHPWQPHQCNKDTILKKLASTYLNSSMLPSSGRPCSRNTGISIPSNGTTAWPRGS